MYLLYLDDAGAPGTAAEEYFALGGICVFEAQVDWFSREIDKLAAPYNAAAPEDVKFHASTIFSRHEDPWKGLSINEARGALKSLLNVVSDSYNTTRLFACAINKNDYPGRDPVEMAFEDLCRRFDLFLSRRKAAGDSQRGMIILDKTTRETSLQKLSREFRKVGTQWGVLRNIADTPFFVDSRARGLCRSPTMSPIPFSAATIPATLNISISSLTASMLRITSSMALRINTRSGTPGDAPRV